MRAGRLLLLLLSLSWRAPSINGFAVVGKGLTRGKETRRHLPFLRPTPTAARQRALSVSLLPTTIPTADPTYLSTMLLLLSYFGIQLEQSTRIGKAVSAPLVTMGFGLLLANVGLLPFEHHLYNLVNQYAVALAVPLLLFDSDLQKVLQNTGSLLVCFGVGCVGTIVGTIASMAVLQSRVPWKVAAALAARHIGGAINFVAVSETLHIPASLVSSAIAADNIVVALYFLLLFALSKEGEQAPATVKGTTIPVSKNASTTTNIETLGDSYASEEDQAISLSSIALSLSVSSSLVLLGKTLTRCLLPSGTSALPLTSLLTVMAATVFSKFFAKLRATGSALGIFFIQLFFACSGASGSIALVLKQAPMLFVFSVLQIAIHFGFINCFRRVLNPNELYLASNANVGGPTTAAAMAQAKNWGKLVMPALLVGILGYATATGIALALGPLLIRLQ